LRELGLRTLAGRDLESVGSEASELRKQVHGAHEAFSLHEQGDLLIGLEALTAASRELRAHKPRAALCDTIELLARVLTGGGKDNRLHDMLTDVAEPVHRRLTDLANLGGLSCAEPQWFRDADGDGYGEKAAMKRAAKQPAGFVANSLDCFDRNREAHPGQKRFFDDHRGDGRFDYDCDGRESRRSELVAGGCRKLTRFGIPVRCWADEGWRPPVLACGKPQRWLVTCEASSLFCDDERDELRSQQCR
jgi:hypothetical protein